MLSTYRKLFCTIKNSVGDQEPDPDPHDPHVFGPPGSGSISQRCGSGSGSGPGSLPVLNKCAERTEIMPAK
jgi:hypothetical protein